MNGDQEILQKFIKIFENNPALMAITSMPERIFTGVNTAFLNKLGYSRDEIIGKSIFEMGLMPETEIFKIADEVRATGNVANLELQFKSKDGAIHYMLFSGEIIENRGKSSFFMVMVDITEQILLTEMLAQKKRKLELVIEGGGLGTWEWDIRTGHTILNERWAEIIGYTLAELQSESVDVWKANTQPDDLAKARSLLRKYFNKEIDSYASEVRMRHKTGHWVWVLIRGKVVEWSADGQPLRMFGTHADITKEKQAAEELKESELRFNLALNNTEAGLWDWDMRTNTVFYSPKWKSMLGYEEHEIDNSFAAWEKLWHPDDRPAIEKAMEDYFSGRTTHYEVTHRLRHKNGQWRWILTRGGILKDAEGNPYRWVGTNIDITAEKERSAELERFFSVNLDLLCIANTEGRFIKTNKAWSDILGYSAQELAERKFLEFVHPDDLSATLKALAKLAKQHNVINFVNRFRSKDGSYRFIEWRSHPYGNLVYAAARDITARIQAEEKIKEVAIRDPLTNIFNRKYIFERLAGILAEYKRAGKPFSVAILDIDHFKNINDEFGHLAGDVILEQFTKVIGGNLRPYDLLGRYGGEEFIIVSANTQREQLMSIIDRIFAKVRDKTFIYDEKEIRFTFSAGISDSLEFSKAAITVEEVVKKADKRLYDAKRTGRNKAVLFD